MGRRNRSERGLAPPAFRESARRSVVAVERLAHSRNAVCLTWRRTIQIAFRDVPLHPPLRPLCYNVFLMLLRRILLVLAAVILVALAFLSGYATYPLLHQGAAPPLTAAGAAASDMSQYWQIWSLLDRDFYGAQPDAQARNRGAITGMVQTFGDPYTFWVEPQTRELERDDLAGRFGGIGATVERTPDAFVLHPLADQPAARAGIVDGDRLVAVDGQPITTTMDVNAVVTLIRGPVGTAVTLTVNRGESDARDVQELEFAIERAEIRTPSVEWRLLDDDAATADIGYLRQTLFSECSGAEMEQGIDELRTAGATRFIWDLAAIPAACSKRR